MNKLAEELNAALDGTAAGRMLSGLGRRIYFPKGIIAQSAEAGKNAHTANATIGMAFKDGKPMILSAVAGAFSSLSPGEIVAYAPTAGVEKLRNAWKEALLSKNPSLSGASISLPEVVPGLSAGIAYLGELFLEEGRSIISSYPSWDNYALTFEERRGAHLKNISFFKPQCGLDQSLDIETIKAAVDEDARSGTVRLILNFPNNPAGYSPTVQEADALCGILLEAAEKGADVLVLVDDAYFGLNYEPDVYGESLFARLASLHDNILAVKIDGPTKEEYAWGLRLGFLTFGSKSLTAEQAKALETKVMGLVRSAVSCASTPSQSVMLRSLADKRSAGEKAAFGAILEGRYRLVKDFTGNRREHRALRPLPFNSGYFMSFFCQGFPAEKLRQVLLYEHGIGTRAMEEHYLRVAFSSVEAEQIGEIYGAIYASAEALAR
jgi:aspartate/methionine/tyrosine aminotransferase